MKIRKIKNHIWKKHIKTDALNKKRRLQMLRKNKETEEQLLLASACVKLDEYFMKWTTKQMFK